ncbi:MAG: tetratricopeptide repeat protein [Rhodoluna sp.]
MNNPKVGAILLSIVTLIYLVLMTNQAITLIQVDNLIAKTMGAVLFGLPVVGVWSIIRELKFGIQVEKLANLVRAENAWPSFDLELRPSGRPTRASAEKAFAEYAELAEKSPDDWHSWFNLSLAYDAAGDSRRARSSMRTAIALRNK